MKGPYSMKGKTMKRICLLLAAAVLAGCRAKAPAPVTSAAKTSAAKTSAAETQAAETSAAEASAAEISAAQTGAAEAVQPPSKPAPLVTETKGAAAAAPKDVDYFADYTADIRADVSAAVSSSSSLQQELAAVRAVNEKYTELSHGAQTQHEINRSSEWFYTIWDAELNDLWNRIRSTADAGVMERLLKEQRNWVAMKEEITLEAIGHREDGGSMYPMLWNVFQAEITERRAYILAAELAKIRGEAFMMPEKSNKYGIFADNQGTGSVYSSLITEQFWGDADRAEISIFRTGHLSGMFTEQEDGSLAFVSSDEKVRGIIRIDPWKSAVFEVTDCVEPAIVHAGEVFEFDFVF